MVPENKGAEKEIVHLTKFILRATQNPNNHANLFSVKPWLIIGCYNSMQIGKSSRFSLSGYNGTLSLYIKQLLHGLNDSLTLIKEVFSQIKLMTSSASYTNIYFS